MTTLAITPRMISIRKIQILRETTPYSGGDWDDHLSEQMDRLPAKMEGITDSEIGTLGQAYCCPRMVSEFLSKLDDEIEGKEDEIDFLIKDFISIHKRAFQLEKEARELRESM